MMRTVLVLWPLFLFLLPNLALSKMLVRQHYDIDSSVDLRSQKSWTTLGKTYDQSFKQLFQILDRSKTAREVLSMARNRAQEQGTKVSDLLQAGEVSVCDMTLVRRFSPTDPSRISYQQHHQIYINKQLTILDGALDLIHELTHFSLRESFNPYQLNFTLPQFMTSTIEGKGGEVDAYMVECQVLSELAPHLERTHSTCQKIKDPSTGKLSRYQAAKEFYKIGDDFKTFWKMAKKFNIEKGEIFPVTDDDATFISSVSNTSYPLAAISDYVKIMKRSCSNDQRRIASFEADKGRSPASVKLQQITQAQSQLQQSFDQRCSQYLQD